MKQICQSKYKQETAEQEYQLLNQQIADCYLPSQSFENSPMAQSLNIDSVSDVNLRQQLFNQYKGIAVQSRAKLFHINMTSAQAQREEYTKKYEESVQKMWSDYQSSNDNQKLSSAMIQLINQCCDKIGERIKCVYKFKAQSIQSSI